MPYDLLLLAISFTAMWLLVNRMHRRLQQVFTLLTRRSSAGEKLYTTVLLPGTAIHETSHALAALLLGVRVRRFSLRPRQISGNALQLGFVETDRADVVRRSLIGAAPLITGVGLLLFITRGVFGLHDIFTAAAALDARAVLTGIAVVFETPYALAWALLVFIIVHGMLPSKSDMLAWPPVLAGVAALGTLVYTVGGDALREWLRSGATSIAHQLGGALLVSLMIQLAASMLIEIIFKLMLRARGYR
jgi:hypothetical protein